MRTGYGETVKKKVCNKIRPLWLHYVKHADSWPSKNIPSREVMVDWAVVNGLRVENEDVFPLKALYSS